MRHISISVTILLIFIFLWGFYVYNSDFTIKEFNRELHGEVLPQIVAGNWTEAADEFQDFKEDWKDYRRLAHLFYNTTKINEIDLSIASCEQFINSKEEAEATGEVARLAQLLKYLHQSEQLTFANLL